MVLLIENNIVNSIPEKNLNSYLSLYNYTKNFTSQDVKVIDPHFSLYVGQGEYAIIPTKDNPIKVIGSDSATTCHIVILHHSSGGVAVGHFDGSKNEYNAVENMVNELVSVGNEQQLNAYVVGGYIDSMCQQQSEALSLKILQMFMNVSCSIHLLLWCTGETNTKINDDQPFPIFNGLAIDRQNFEVFPAVFPTQVPNHDLRSASFWVADNKVCVNIYDFKSKTVSIQPFFEWDKDLFQIYKTFPDHLLLKHFSTSPFAQPPTFCNRLRRVFKLLGTSTAESLFPKSQPRVYKMNSAGEWREV